MNSVMAKFLLLIWLLRRACMYSENEWKLKCFRTHHEARTLSEHNVG